MCSLSSPALFNSYCSPLQLHSLHQFSSTAQNRTEPLNQAYHLYGNLHMMCLSLIGYLGGFVHVSFQGMMQDDKEI